MTSSRNHLLNAGLVLLSVAVVFGIALAADRVFGMVAPPPRLPGTMELIFPPHARQSYESIEFAYTAHINRLGLREREIEAKQPGVFRICAIGDSYTYGWGVEAEQTWLRRLEEILQARGLKVETINLGKPGSGPPDYSKLAQKALPMLQPDLVVVGILMGNDIIASAPDSVIATRRGPAAAIASALFPNITRYLQRPHVPVEERTVQVPPQISTAEDNIKWTRNTAQDFLAKMTAQDRERYARLDPKVREGFETGRFNPYMVDLALKAPDVYNGTLKLDDPWIQEATGAVAEHLKIIAAAAEAEGAQTIVAALPDGPYVNDHAWRTVQGVGYEPTPGMVDSGAPERAVQMAAERAGLPFLSVASAFKQHRDDPGLYFEFDGHMTAKGHALFAESIAPLVEPFVREGAK
jgi:lysophospholipase L1-like esterase